MNWVCSALEEVWSAAISILFFARVYCNPLPLNETKASPKDRNQKSRTSGWLKPGPRLSEVISDGPDSPGSTACTLTGESEQMVNPYPSLPRRMVTCKTRTHKLLGREDHSLPPPSHHLIPLAKLSTSFPQDEEGDLDSASSY